MIDDMPPKVKTDMDLFGFLIGAVVFVLAIPMGYFVVATKAALPTPFIFGALVLYACALLIGSIIRYAPRDQ